MTTGRAITILHLVPKLDTHLITDKVSDLDLLVHDRNIAADLQVHSIPVSTNINASPMNIFSIDIHMGMERRVTDTTTSHTPQGEATDSLKSTRSLVVMSNLLTTGRKTSISW